MQDKLIANRYRVHELIGQGGMADVYKGYDEVLNRDVAIKVLRGRLADDPAILVRFLREASAASRLHHPNVVDIYDVGEMNGTHYIIMEYVDGVTLKEKIVDTGPMTTLQAVSMMRQLCAAVAAAHGVGIIHRDIKPQNVLVRKDGRLKITDFGIAVASGSISMTHQNAVMGSAHYLAPESAAGLQPDNRVDIYSLGIVFFELLCGSVPFSGTSPAQIALKHMQDPLPNIRPFNPGVCQSIENVVIKAAAKDPDERYQTVQEFEDAITRALDPVNRNEPPLVLKTSRLELPAANEPATPKVRVPEQKKEEARRPLPQAPEPGKLSMRTKVVLGLIVCALVVLIALASIASGLTPVAGLFDFVKIPQIVGLSQEDAIQALLEAGLQQDQIEIKEEVSDSVPSGEVISAKQPAGSVYKASEPFTITISKGPSYLIADYTGQYLNSVLQQFEDDGVSIQVNTVYQSAADTNPGIILSQDGLQPGDRVDPQGDETITFTVSSYPTITISSDLIGMDINEAKEYLNSRGIAVSLANTNGGSTVVDVSPSVGTNYVQEGTDSVVTLYY